MLSSLCVSALEICRISSQRKSCKFVIQSIGECLIYLVFVGKGFLAQVPSHLPHLRRLCLKWCVNVCDKYVEELVAAVPELEVIK